ncbi:MAG: feruloyl-CoA synthase [Solirubrobacterales bacterium]|nr:feruloyl-CoA synthase [Solirubrobacterales bacterium]
MSMVAERRTFAAPDTAVARRDDGTIIVSSRHTLEHWEPSLPAVLRAAAQAHPDRPLAAERDEHQHWVVLSYGEARRKADALAQAFLDLGLGPERPIMILSGNSVAHLLVSLAAYTAGVPVMPLSVAYSLMSSDLVRIRAIAELTDPGLVFADDAAAFAQALDAVDAEHILVARGECANALRLDELAQTSPGNAVEDAFGAITPDTTAKLLFTSGSTGVPKGVINTHRMLCSNQAMLQLIWPFLVEEPPVLVDWLPWSHTFGANHNLNLVLFNGGTLHIDDGKPAPPLFPRTIAALKAISPTVYFNVPAGFALLAPALESDQELAQSFFSRLRFMFYAGAALPEALAARLTQIARSKADHEVPLTSSWGTTETAPGATSAHFAAAAVGCIGVPLAGTAVKLAPVGDKLEIRVSGPQVTPGYFRAPELTQSAFDEEGYYRSGDAGKLVDEHDVNKGLLFDGRIAEDFKLLTGTWVTAGPLRMRLLSETRVLTDAVICGQDCDYVAALAWVNQAEARKLTDGEGDVSPDHPRLREHLAKALATLNQHAGSAARIERLLLLAMPPSLDVGEITDKGYINQRACLESRAAEVARLYAADLDPEVITPAS